MSSTDGGARPRNLASFGGHQGFPRVILQAVNQPPRVHLDIETDDREAECARMEALGATASATGS